MKSMIHVSLLFAFCAAGAAQMEVQVCNPKTLEPLDWLEVMTGTQVALVVSSDANSLWTGGLFLRDDDRLLGSLSGRDKDPNSRDWIASHLPAAGPAARVIQWRDSSIWGFDLYTDELYPEPGPWFVIDYMAQEPGDCMIEFYDTRYSWTQCDPNLSFVLHNTLTRDLNADERVTLADFYLFSQAWQQVGCYEPQLCARADFDLDGTVGLMDLAEFSEYWLWGTPGWQPAPPVAERGDPNIIYYVADAYGNASVTMNVGETDVFYIYKTTYDEIVNIINLEVTISDPNLGWIDNTAYDPNDPANSGTAAILSQPRYEDFDYWGPGYTQPEGIVFLVVSFFDPLPDGAVASFQYTAAAAGHVTLDLINHNTDYTTLLPLEIEQAEPQLMMMSSPESDTTELETTDSVEYLERIYEESEELRQTIDPNSWNEFIEEVRQAELLEGSIQ